MSTSLAVATHQHAVAPSALRAMRSLYEAKDYAALAKAMAALVEPLAGLCPWSVTVNDVAVRSSMVPDGADRAIWVAGKAVDVVVEIGDHALRQDVRDAIAELSSAAGEAADALEQRVRAAWTADHDGLTNLLATGAFERAVAERQRALGGATGVAVIKVEGLSTITASFGAAATTVVLRAVAANLLAIPHVEEVASLGGGRLGALVVGDQVAVAEALASSVTTSVRIGTHTVAVTAHAGVAVDDTRTEGDAPMPVTPRRLLTRAEVACSHAGVSGDAVVVHTPELAASLHARLAMACRLRAAIERGAIEVHYQPQVDASGAVVSVEALARWHDGENGWISPAEFVPVAEASSLIVDLDLYVLARAVEQVAGWRRQGHHVALAANLSTRTVSRQGIVEEIVEIASRAGLEANALELEVTESIAATDDARLVSVLHAMRSHGLRVAVDDFGTGYSSLARIHKLPLDRIKIDRSFVSELDSPAGGSVAAAVVALGQGLGLEVLAEGVETAGQRDALIALGCDSFQGYFFSRPAPANEIAVLLSSCPDSSCRLSPGRRS